MRVTSGGTHLCCLAPGQHNCDDTSQRWRTVGDTVSGLTVPRIENSREPWTSHTDSGHVFMNNDCFQPSIVHPCFTFTSELAFTIKWLVIADVSELMT